MILPGTADGLPPWRRQVMRWLMAAARLAVGWFVCAAPLTALVLEPSFIRDAFGVPLRWVLALALGIGIPLFTWPRSYLAGLVVLVAGLAAYEALWWYVGLPAGRVGAASAAVLAVLAGGEWLARRLQARLGSG